MKCQKRQKPAEKCPSQFNTQQHRSNDILLSQQTKKVESLPPNDNN